MDTTAQRTIKAARDMLVDRLGGCSIVPADASWGQKARAMGHDFTPAQAEQLVRITNDLWDLLGDLDGDEDQADVAGCAHALDVRNCIEVACTEAEAWRRAWRELAQDEYDDA